MADFATTPPPSEAPNFTRGYSEPISQPLANKSTGIALDTAAKGIEDFSKIATETAKNVIDTDVRNTVDPIRNDFTTQLEQARAALLGTTYSPDDLLAGKDATPVPNAVKIGIDKAQSLQDAFVNGHINDTWYHMQLANAATSLRTKYPGFVDYVDEEFGKITGVKPANAVITDLMQDINRAGTQKKTEFDKVVDEARKIGTTSGYAHADDMYNTLVQKGASYVPTYMKWANEEAAKDTELKRKMDALKYKESAEKDVAEDSGKLYTDYVTTKISSDLNGAITIGGLDQPQSFTSLGKIAQENPSQLTAQQWAEVATKFQAHAAQMRSELLQMSAKDGWNKRITSAAVTTEIDNQMQIYKSFSDGIVGGGAAGFGAAMFAMNHAKAVADQTKDNFTKSDLYTTSENYRLFREKVGPEFPGVIDSFMAANKNMPDRMKALFTEKAIEAHAQPNGPDNPTTIQQHMSEIENNPKITAAERGYVYKGLVDLSSSLKNPNLDPDDKAGMVRYFFNPTNNSILNNWKMDYKTTSPDGSRTIERPGKHSIWNELFDRGVTDGVSKLDDKSKAYYLGAATRMGNELLGQDVKDLNRFTGHDNIYFEWHNNADGRPFLVVRDKEAPTTSEPAFNRGAYNMPSHMTNSTNVGPPPGYRQHIDDVVGRVNSMLPQLEHVYSKLGGGNTETMLLQTLQQYGLDFEGKVTGLPKAFGDAIAASRKAPKSEKVPEDK